MMRGYIDDSRGDGVMVLAGWVAPAKVWSSFSDEWDRLLRMSPRIGHFKYTEARNGNGEFNGISEESRDFKLKLLVRCIEDHGLVAISTVVPLDIFDHFFGQRGSGVMRTPYALAFVNIYRRLYLHLTQTGNVDQLDLIFDMQVDQMGKAIDGWNEFAKNAPEAIRPMIGNPPNYQDDKRVLPLQAADLCAGWTRELNGAELSGEPLPKPMWGDAGDAIPKHFWVLSVPEAIMIYRVINGREPPPFVRPRPSSDLEPKDQQV